MNSYRSSNGYLLRRDPLREFDGLIRAAFGPTAPERVSFSPAVESHRDGDDAVIRLELPGVDVEKDVNVEVKGRVLVVSGERQDQSEGSRFSQFRYGSFRRTFRLAPQVTAEDVSASYDAGVLTVRVAGAFAETEGHRVSISTAGASTEPNEG